MKKVLGNRVLGKEIKQQKTDSGILIADTVETEKTRFEVVAIGDEVTQIEVGNVVQVPSRIGKGALEIMVDGENLFVLTENQIVLVDDNE